MQTIIYTYTCKLWCPLKFHFWAQILHVVWKRANSNFWHKRNVPNWDDLTCKKYKIKIILKEQILTPIHCLTLPPITTTNKKESFLKGPGKVMVDFPRFIPRKPTLPQWANAKLCNCVYIKMWPRVLLINLMYYLIS